MELDAVRALEAEGLVRVGGRPGETDGTVRQVERVAVPLEGDEILG